MDVMHSIFCSVFLLFAVVTVANSHGCAKLPASKAYHGSCYFQYVRGLGFVKRHCPSGTRYSEHECGCVHARQSVGSSTSVSRGASATASASSSATSTKSTATASASARTRSSSSFRLSDADRHRIYRILFSQSGPRDYKNDDKEESEEDDRSDDRSDDNDKYGYRSGDDKDEEDDDSSHDFDDYSKYGSLLSGLEKSGRTYSASDSYAPAMRSGGSEGSGYGEENEDDDSGDDDDNGGKYYGFDDEGDENEDDGYNNNGKKAQSKIYHFGDILDNIFDSDDNNVLDDFDDIFENKFYGLFEFVDDMFDDIFDDGFDDFYDDLFDDDGYDDVFVGKYKHYFDDDSDTDDIYLGFDDFFENFNHVKSLSLGRGYENKVGSDDGSERYGASNDDSDSSEEKTDEREGIWAGKGAYAIFGDGYGKEGEGQDDRNGDSRLFNFARTLKGGNDRSGDIESILDGFYRDDN